MSPVGVGERIETARRSEAGTRATDAAKAGIRAWGTATARWRPGPELLVALVIAASLS